MAKKKYNRTKRRSHIDGSFYRETQTGAASLGMEVSKPSSQRPHGKLLETNPHIVCFNACFWASVTAAASSGQRVSEQSRAMGNFGSMKPVSPTRATTLFMVLFVRASTRAAE